MQRITGCSLRIGLQRLVSALMIVALSLPPAPVIVQAAPALQTAGPPTPTLDPTATVDAVATPTATETLNPAPTETATGTGTGIATVTPSETPSPSTTPTIEATATPATVPPTAEPAAALPLQFTLAASPGQATPGSEVTFTLTLTNPGETSFTNVVFSDSLPADFGESKAGFGELAFDPTTRALTWTAKEILPKTTVTLQYTLTVSAEAQPPLYLSDTALLTAAEMKEPVKAIATLLVASADQPMSDVAATGGDAKGLSDKVQIVAPPGAITTGGRHALIVKDMQTKYPAGDGQTWQAFEIQLLGDPGVADLAAGKATATPDPIETIAESDEHIALQPVEAKFEKPVELTVSFNGLADLSTLSAEYKPFLVTLDEASGVWVDVPIRINREANTISTATTHFSTWGAGIGASFPTGANITLFDSAKPELFTGRSHFSIPIWTPPGRNGMAPSLSLSYTSGMADGVLGDVQAPWTGLGWSVDTVEITRKITNGTCSPCGAGSGATGYGYRDEYILTFNGIGGKLIPEVNNPSRYHTKDESFVYVQRHNDQYPPASPSNATGEWWEVVGKDGTRWRLGYDENDTTGAHSEQLAAMKGYPGNNTGAWSSLGYAGHATDVVAMRWRADQVTDTHGNTMRFHYFEESRTVAGTTTNYDKASYLDYVSYTSHTSGAPAPQYWVEFVRAARTTDVPTAPKEFDNWDTLLLDKINVKYGTNLATATIVRTYDLTQGFQTGSYVNVLQSVDINGPLNSGASVPKLSFTYGNFNNNGTTGIPYPRLTTINNNAGGTVTFSYGNDGRTGANTWLNYRVINTSVADGVSGQTMQTGFAYLTPCYNDDPVNGGGTGWCNGGNIGDLVGYGQTTVTTKDFNGTTLLGITVHKFFTDEQRAGQEYEVQNQDAAGVIQSQTNTDYTVLSNDLPAQTYFPYASAVENKVRQSGALTFVNRTEYDYDPNTGNLVSQKEYDAPGPTGLFAEDYEVHHDLTQWSSSVTNGGTLSVTTGSHLNGAYGMHAGHR